MNDTGKLQNSEQAALAQRAKSGDRRATERLVTSNMGFVINLAKEYQGRGVEFDDLVSEGALAMITAIPKWDSAKTSDFVKYAVWDIRKAMERIVEREGQIVRVPEGYDGKFRSMDAPLRPGHTRSLGETMPQHDAVSASDATDDNAAGESIAEGIEHLNERERRVVTLFYGIDCNHLTMAEIAEDMGLKRERVRQIRKNAERKLRKFKK